MTTRIAHFGATKVMRWGNGLGIRIPLTLARRAGLEEGTRLDLLRDGNVILLQPLTDVPSLDGLLAAVQVGSVPKETEWTRGT